MKILLNIFLFAFILNTKFILAQTDNCDIEKITKADKQLLNEFWVDFKTAINGNDKEALSSLIKFPIICDYCKPSSAKQPYIKLSEKQFKEKYFELFLDPKLIKRINDTESLFSILVVNKDESGKCGLDFGYSSIEPSETSEGKQHFFSLKKVKDKYLITSAWTIP
ncbi:hypothetical protein J0383_02540 [Flavobacterium endoglycinae]|uniref:DUF4440 domain-containing protein n=1 Tax=Flavobacterium endoglycinae TaxID=2816357 RepID=A0ABX7QGJ1_9FLAO|nr:hypothetical protein [Flavobacterium endoglycinae]QSW89701.1 hypothetical protein J0383_02540 [Flavobacterium endoglycinae]